MLVTLLGMMIEFNSQYKKALLSILVTLQVTPSYSMVSGITMSPKYSL